MYELILIDADNTLFDFDKAEKYALVQALEQFGFNSNIDEIVRRYKIINSDLWIKLEKGTITKDALRTERYKRLFKESGLEYPVEEFSEYYLKKLSECSFLIDGAEDVCKYLSEKYKVVIVTNGIREVQLSRLKKSTINKYIDDIVISEAIGINKPDPKIFEYALKLVKHKDKKSAIMIGDSLSSDIQGGINFGIDTCWFNAFKVKNETGIIPNYQIGSLKELMDIL